MNRHLVVLGCSATKLDSEGLLPAIARYDGPSYRVLNNYLRDVQWPTSLSVGILSAEHGLIGGLTHIENYDRRMDAKRALDLRTRCTEVLTGWAETHGNVSLFLGRDYLPALNLDTLSTRGSLEIVPGPIGMKLSRLRSLLHGLRRASARRSLPERADRALYFLPDWDDHVDADFDFRGDQFSNADRHARNQKHCTELVHPRRMCDGVLISLAQLGGSKGLLRRFAPTDPESLAPMSIAKRFGLGDDQLAFGDCGAFSYSSEDEPPISTEQAVSLYQIYGFDLGASVDHIPLPVITTASGKQRRLSRAEQRRRVAITQRNAADFIAAHQRRRCTFEPVGIIQSIDVAGYASQLAAYVEMGYATVAIGGLVPRPDREVAEIAATLESARAKLPPTLREQVWIHLFGIYRPKIQDALRAARIDSFDSATYFRKAWLRSSQNYLAADGSWYAAVRVPVTSDARTLARLTASGLSEATLREREKAALAALHAYGRRRKSLDATLNIVLAYDSLLGRGDGTEETDLRATYRRTLQDRPWESCDCAICSEIGIDTLIFRGYNRNKRRGAHNTLMLYENVLAGGGDE
jgi:hypothetical protein